MSTPTCRTCYLSTLSKDERDRFVAEPITGTIYYCPEHERVFNNLMDSLDWDHVVLHGVRTGRIVGGISAIEEIDRDWDSPTGRTVRHEPQPQFPRARP